MSLAFLLDIGISINNSIPGKYWKGLHMKIMMAYRNISESKVFFSPCKILLSSFSFCLNNILTILFYQLNILIFWSLCIMNFSRRYPCIFSVFVYVNVHIIYPNMFYQQILFSKLQLARIFRIWSSSHSHLELV